jgi:DUF1680 family protein
MDLDEDALLRPFRMAAAFPAPGNDLGGWYSTPRFLGETFGQWISALSRYYAATAHEATRQKVERLMDGYAKTIDATGQIFQINGNPLYLHDKLVTGLEDAASFARSSLAREALSLLMTNSQVIFEKKEAWLQSGDSRADTENFNFAETYLTAWQRIGDPHCWRLGNRDLQDGFCEPLSQGRDVLAGRHAYSHVNGLCSAAKGFLVLGDVRYLNAAINGLAFIEQQSFASGGWGPNEQFLPQSARHYSIPGIAEVDLPPMESVGESLTKTQWHFETGCGSYAHFKLTRYLLRITKNPQYGDSMERVMYNAALGAKRLTRFGKAFYQSNYHDHARKAYYDGDGNVWPDEWPCCSGTLSQLAADYGVSTYFRDQDGLFVNLFIPSAASWQQGGTAVTLTQSGAYPLDDQVTLVVTTSRPARFAVRVRIPNWARAPTVRVNGVSLSERVRSGTFATIRRAWKTGDRIVLELPRGLQLKAADADHPDLAALMCGPLVLFAISDDTPRVTRAQLLAARQVAPGSVEWRADTGDGPLRLTPFWNIKDEMYFTYLSLDS